VGRICVRSWAGVNCDTATLLLGKAADICPENCAQGARPLALYDDAIIDPKTRVDNPPLTLNIAFGPSASFQQIGACFRFIAETAISRKSWDLLLEFPSCECGQLLSYTHAARPYP
jgi:hypothetical protein